jgi:hypothetical protein
MNEKFHQIHSGSESSGRPPIGLSKKLALWLALIENSGAEIGLSGFDSMISIRRPTDFTEENFEKTRQRMLDELETGYEHQAESLSNYVGEIPPEGKVEIEKFKNLYEKLKKNLLEWQPVYK